MKTNCPEEGSNTETSANKVCIQSKRILTRIFIHKSSFSDIFSNCDIMALFAANSLLKFVHKMFENRENDVNADFDDSTVTTNPSFKIMTYASGNNSNSGHSPPFCNPQSVWEAL